MRIYGGNLPVTFISKDEFMPYSLRQDLDCAVLRLSLTLSAHFGENTPPEDSTRSSGIPCCGLPWATASHAIYYAPGELPAVQAAPATEPTDVQAPATALLPAVQ